MEYSDVRIVAKHAVRITTGPMDELIAWVILVEILVFGTFGIAKLIEWVFGV